MMDPYADQRNAANLRSINRSDPTVLEILETSVHSTIYHYITPEGTTEAQWIKQKAEGPLFIVRRSVEPEYALFMLNRATPKNVTIALIKGEMKARDVGEGMMQVARRAEKFKRGVWFAEPQAVQRFAAEITRICGPPSQRPDSVVQTTSAAQTPVPEMPLAPSASSSGFPPGGGDGFSRLFAGLMTDPSRSLPASPNPPRPVPSAPPIPTLPSPPQEQHLYQPIPVPKSSALASNPAPEPNTLPPTSFPPPQNPFTPPPGQTVGDLLNDLLGLGSFPPPNGTSKVSAAPSYNLTAPPPPQLSQQLSRDPQHPIVQDRKQPPPLSNLPSADTPPPIPLETKPESLHVPERQSHHAQSPVREAIDMPPMVDLRGSRPTASPPMTGSSQPGQSINANDLLAGIHSSMMPSPSQSQHRFQSSPMRSAPMFDPPQPSIPPPPAQSAILDSVVDALGGAPDLRSGGRDGFPFILSHLIKTEPRFVDDIWAGYLRRMGGG